MNNISNSDNNNKIRIEKVSKNTPLKEEEKDLSKTMQFKLLNSKNKIQDKKNNNFDDDDEIILPEKSLSLGETIRLKISDLRAKIEEEFELPVLKKKRSLYDTVIVKLDDIINSRKALKHNNYEKVTKIEEPKIKKKFHFFKPKDITKSKTVKINVDSEEFGRQLYSLNKIALINLRTNQNAKVRKNFGLIRIGNIEKIHISKTNYLQYQSKLNSFAINKLYYKFAPKETKKYKIYKYSVIASSIVLVISSLLVVNWFIGGISISKLNNSLKRETPIEIISDEGNIVNMVPEEEDTTDQTSDQFSLYRMYANTPLSSVNFTELVKLNSDTVGWIIVNNTKVNYPVVQSSNNDYYLNHAFDKSSNIAGWIFADFRDDFNNLNRNLVIYGHSRKDNLMFGSLNTALNEEWHSDKNNQLIQLSTLKYNTMWQIFSIYKIKAESYYITTDFSSDESYEKFLKTMKERSIYDFGINVNKNDKILTLSTCYNTTGTRTVIQAKLVKIQAR